MKELKIIEKEKQGQLHMLCIDDLVPKNHILRDIDIPVYDDNFSA